MSGQEVANTDMEPARARLLPTGTVYTSQDIFDAEMRTIFRSSWMHVADLCDLQQPGDYVATKLGRAPVLIVRQQDGELRGFLNACRHRAMQIASGTGNCNGRFTCPYHGWTYKPDGELVGISQRQRFGELVDHRGLIPIHVAAIGPMVFGCLDEPPVPLEVWFEETLREFEGSGWETLVPSFEHTWDIRANWKLLVENALEGYHVAMTHPTLRALVEFTGAEENAFGEFGSSTKAPLTPAVGTMLSSFTAATYGYFGFVFPTLVPTHTARLDYQYMKIEPVAPDRSRVTIRNFDVPQNPIPLESRRDLRLQVMDEDAVLLEKIQEAIGTVGLPRGTFSPTVEPRLGHFHEIHTRRLG